MLRKIKSFTRRQRKLSPNKQKIFDKLWPKYGLNINTNTELKKSLKENITTTLEIGFGNGENLFYIAKSSPNQNFIGIEIHEPGIANLLTFLEETPLDNLKIFNEDANTVIKDQLPDNSLDNILILFSDPWPKKRHHKRRLIQTKFVKLLHQKLKQNGVLNIATDWGNYARHIEEIFADHSGFSNIGNMENFSAPIKRQPTKFEKRGKDKGHNIFEYYFIKPKSMS